MKCDYNGGKWDDGECEFYDEDDEKEYNYKLKTYHGVDEEEVKQIENDD